MPRLWHELFNRSDCEPQEARDLNQTECTGVQGWKPYGGDPHLIHTASYQWMRSWNEWSAGGVWSRWPGQLGENDQVEQDWGRHSWRDCGGQGNPQVDHQNLLQLQIANSFQIWESAGRRRRPLPLHRGDAQRDLVPRLLPQPRWALDLSLVAALTSQHFILLPLWPDLL